VEHGDAVSHTSDPSQKSFIPMLYIGDADRLAALMFMRLRVASSDVVEIR
jgi:hypothetical protein